MLGAVPNAKYACSFFCFYGTLMLAQKLSRLRRREGRWGSTRDYEVV